MDRRQFLTSAAMATGYSLMVRVDGPAKASAAEFSVDRMREDFNRIAPGNADRKFDGKERNMVSVDLPCDVFIAGGGQAGCAAALAAARQGAKVVLAQDRSRLGGNASSEVKMHIVGADVHGGRKGWREGGIMEEMRLEDAYHNRQNEFEIWDLMLYDRLIREPNITLLLDSAVYAADTKGGKIERAHVRSDKTEHLYTVPAKIFMDCTGDCRLGLEAGASMRMGREPRSEFGETLAPEKLIDQTLGSSILFTSREHDKPMPFVAPPWARKIGPENLGKKRGIGSWEYGYWWIEWGGNKDPIHDNERIRFELLSIVLGVWDYIKNSGKYPKSANWAMDWVGMVPGKRGSRRINGDHILTQYDLINPNKDFEDAVAIGGWSMDDHPSSGFDDPNLPPCVQVRVPEVYNIPLRSLYSKNIDNLMMAGRNISASHVAFTSTRVMATCNCIGQAAGTAAAVCALSNLTPRGLYENKTALNDYVQTLLRNDQTIKNRVNEDPNDLARKAKAKASDALPDAPAENVIRGFTRDIPKGDLWRWSAPMPTSGDSEGPWVELTWDEPQKLQEIQLVFDSGFQRELTLSKLFGVLKRQVRGPQPETVKDYKITYKPKGSDKYVELASVEGNYQRLNRHTVKPVEAEAIRVQVLATNGDPLARIFEIRCYS